MKKVMFGLFVFISFTYNISAHELKAIYIDGKSCPNDETIETCASGETYKYDSSNKVLTLDNYNGGRINISRITSTEINDSITIVLKGNNIITEESTSSPMVSAIPLTLKSDNGAALKLNGIYTAAGAHTIFYVNESLVIDNVNLEVNETYNFLSTANHGVYGIVAQKGLTIKNNSIVAINITNDYNSINGMIFGGSNIEKPPLRVEKGSKLILNLKSNNVLKSSTLSINSYSTYGGTIGGVDLQIEGEVEETNPVLSLLIGEKRCYNDGTINECFANDSINWNDSTKTLTLDNYNGGKIYIYGQGNTIDNTNSVNVHFKGKNIITEKSIYSVFYSPFNTNITSSDNATVEFNHSRQNTYTNSAVSVKGLLTFDNVNVTINNIYDYESTKDVVTYSVEAQKGIIVKNNSHVIVNTHNAYTSVRSFVVGGTGIEEPPIHLDETSTLESHLSVDNKLKAYDISLRTFTFYSGTIGEPDIQLKGNVIETPSVREIFIGNKKCTNDSNMESCLNGETYSWNSETNTLTLNNYDGESIKIVSIDPSFRKLKPVRIHLKGNNTITSETEYLTPLDIMYYIDAIISADEGATLTVNRKCLAEVASVGIKMYDGNLTIESGDITINNKYEHPTEKSYVVAGIYTNNLELKNKTNLKMNIESDYHVAYGVYFFKDNPTLNISSSSKLEINTKTNNKLNSATIKSNPLYSRNNASPKVNIVYTDDMNEKIVYVGDSKDTAIKVNDIPEDGIDKSYFRIEPLEIVNPKTGDLRSIIETLAIIILFACLPPVLLIKNNK